jgi:predicted O-methyltransferase YrrM
MLFRKFREQAFRELDNPYELAVMDFKAKSRLPDSIKYRLYPWLRRRCRSLDDLLRPDMTAIFLARSLRGKSMLHIESLLGLYECASRCRGAIVEIGTFVGGGTIMMASAMIRSGNSAPIIAIEVGGANSNPHMPTDDVIRDLRVNLEQHGVAQRVSVLEGWSNKVAAEAGRVLGDQRIDLLVIDADGEVTRDIRIYRKYMLPNAMVVIDDYDANEPNIKSAVVKPAVEKMVAEGILRKTKILPWGTWFGSYCG